MRQGRWCVCKMPGYILHSLESFQTLVSVVAHPSIIVHKFKKNIMERNSSFNLLGLLRGSNLDKKMRLPWPPSRPSIFFIYIWCSNIVSFRQVTINQQLNLLKSPPSAPVSIVKEGRYWPPPRRSRSSQDERTLLPSLCIIPKIFWHPEISNDSRQSEMKQVT